MTRMTFSRIARATEAAEATAATTTDSKVKTVLNDMAARSTFDSLESLTAYLGRMSETISDFGDQTFAAPGMDAEGNFDESLYPAGMIPMVALLKKGQGKDKAQLVKAVVITPIPTLDALLADAAGKDWVQKIILKELNHVAVRQLRDADDIAAAVPEMPTTLEAYISSGRDSSGLLESFDELYKDVNKAFADKSPAWARARLIKGELKKALESAAFASEYYPALENRGEGKESLFVSALKVFINAAKKRGLSTEIFDRWTATRDQQTLNVQTQAEEEEIDFDSLADGIAAD